MTTFKNLGEFTEGFPCMLCSSGSLVLGDDETHWYLGPSEESVERFIAELRQFAATARQMKDPHQALAEAARLLCSNGAKGLSPRAKALDGLRNALKLIDAKR